MPITETQKFSTFNTFRSSATDHVGNVYIWSIKHNLGEDVFFTLFGTDHLERLCMMPAAVATETSRRDGHVIVMTFNRAGTATIPRWADGVIGLQQAAPRDEAQRAKWLVWAMAELRKPVMPLSYAEEVELRVRRDASLAEFLAGGESKGNG